MISSTDTDGTDVGAAPAAGPEPVTDGPSSPRPPGRRRARPDSSWWRYGFPAVLALLVVAVPVLVWAGARVVLDSNDGRLVNRVTDPAAPGWEAVVDATPTALVLGLDEQRQLQDVSALVLSGQGSGAVLQIPADTVVPTPYGDYSLAALWSSSTGPDQESVVRDQVALLLGVTFTDTQVVTAEDWAALVQPVSPLTVKSPDAATDATGAVVFPKGSIQVPADKVAAYLGAQGRNESDLARLPRVEAFWRAWLSAVGTKGAASAPQPTDVGLGRYVATLGTDQVRYTTLPVSVAAGSGRDETYRADPKAVSRVVADIVPFPAGPPGTRPRVKVLDGTGRYDHGTSVAVLLGAAGNQVEAIGNAPKFGVETTQIVYYDPETQQAAQAIRDSLGVGELVESSQKSAVDLTVILGDDAAAIAGATTGAVPGTIQGLNGG